MNPDLTQYTKIQKNHKLNINCKTSRKKKPEAKSSGSQPRQSSQTSNKTHNSKKEKIDKLGSSKVKRLPCESTCEDKKKTSHRLGENFANHI